jgi:excisionase family DNA binding protein
MDTQKNTEKLLRVDDVAGILSVRPITVYSWAETGKLKSLKIGRRLLRFREADVRDFIENAGNKANK